jgi:hypothetical protein
VVPEPLHQRRGHHMAVGVLRVAGQT